MAKAAKPKKEITMEEALWKSADKLRGSVEPAEYKHVVLSLFFLKFASDKFEKQRQKLIDMGYESQIEKTFAYTKDNVFFIPPESRWSYIIENAKQDDIALKIDTALYTIEKTNPALKGALPDDGTELKIRKQLIKNNLVEAIIILPQSMFYTTDISVTLWILNKNKKARTIEQNGVLNTIATAKKKSFLWI